MNLAKIQEALAKGGLDGWLFFDHHIRDPLAYRVLGLSTEHSPTRRWYYFIPAKGEPRKVVHRIEPGMLDSLPGDAVRYAGWESQKGALRTILGGAKSIAMQYSPDCAVPYVAMVDAGTVELVRGLGYEIRTSADLVQQFEAVWDLEQFAMHLEAGKRVDRVRAAAFRKIGESLASGEVITEYAIQQFIRESFTREGMVTDHGPIVAVNANASNPHYEPASDSSLPIHRGDLVLIDLWAKLEQPRAVYYDVTWTGVCRPDVPDRMQEVFQVVTGARDAAVAKVQDSVKAGQVLRGYEVDDAARGYIGKAGFGEYFFHRTGHSIGEEVHGTGANMDNLETHDERLVIPQTCFSVEPGIYLPEFGIRSEVNVFVDTASAAVTGEIQRELIRISA